MDWLAPVTNLLIALFAGVALIVAVRQIKISREISALAAYENYHLLCLQYPRFAGGRLDYENSDPDELDSYIVFVLYMLMTGERIFALFPREPGWCHAIEDDIRIHRRFIASEQFREYRENQEWQIKSLIDKVLSEPPLGAPAPRATRPPSRSRRGKSVDTPPAN